jgi:transposase-like protein
MKQITCPHCGDTYPDFDAAHVCSKGPYAPKLKPKMNERIKLLAEQATTIVDTVNSQGYSSSYANFDREKFAELIVLECAVIVGSMEEPHQDIAKLIKQHFGVEE